MEKGKAKQNKHTENNSLPTYPGTPGQTWERATSRKGDTISCWFLPPCAVDSNLEKNSTIKQNRKCCCLFKGMSWTSSSPCVKEQWWASQCCHGSLCWCPVPATSPALTRCWAYPSWPNSRFWVRERRRKLKVKNVNKKFPLVWKWAQLKAC